jgi:hypothetical protein
MYCQLCLLCVVGAVIAGCGTKPLNPPVLNPAVLWAPLGTVIGIDSVGDKPYQLRCGAGSCELSFNVLMRDLNDRDGISTAIVQHFDQIGFKRRSHQSRNPQLPTSFTAGWKSHCPCILQPEFRTEPERAVVYEWEGEWDDCDGNVIQYALFGHNFPNQQASEIRGFVGYFSRAIISSRPVHIDK